MRVIGAFVDEFVGEFVKAWTSELTMVDFLGSGSNAEDVVALCLAHRPDVIIVGGEFFGFVPQVREEIARQDLDHPLWIALVGPPKIYSHERALALGIHSEMTQTQFTDEGFAAAVAIARHALAAAGVEVRIVTAFPTSVPNSTLTAMLKPWTEFRVGANCPTKDELLDVIQSQRPHLVAFGHQCMSDVGAVRQALRESGAVEPQWVLLLSHLDPATLVAAAMIGIENMFASEQFEPVGDFSAWLRECALTGAHHDGPLTRVYEQLTVANDEDDRKILYQLVTGATNEEIASRVFLSVQTVKNRLSRMMTSASVSNRTELALLFAGTTAPRDIQT